jgi:hypothetical protein
MTKADILEERFKNMEEQNNKEHWEIKTLLTSLSNKIDNLENKYVTRLEFKAVSIFLWALATLIWIIVFFINNWN